MLLRLLVLLQLQSAILVSSVDFTIPDSWRKPAITLPIEERTRLAKAALERITPHAGTPGLLLSEMAEYDTVMNETGHHDLLIQIFDGAKVILPGWREDQQHGYAAMRAYRAYNDPTFLAIAQTIWEYGNSYTLTQAQVDAGRTPVKDFEIQPSCASLTMAGGTFWHRDSTRDYIVGLSTGQFLILSALLAESLPENSTLYSQAAQNAAMFIHGHLYNIIGVVQDGITSKAGDGRCATSNQTFPHNSGLFIEGLSILAGMNAVTSFGTSFADLLETSIKAATTFGLWQGENGIIKSDVGKSMLTRALLAVYRRNTTNVPLRNYIKAYMSVQFNAIVENAAVPGANVYSASWLGPPPSDANETYHDDNQVKAISVLIGSIILSKDDVQTPSKQTLSTAAIVGASIGGLILVVCLLCTFIFWRKRPQKRAQQANAQGKEKAIDLLRELEPEPFIQTPNNDQAHSSLRMMRANNSGLIYSPLGAEVGEIVNKINSSKAEEPLEGNSSSIGEKATRHSGVTNPEKHQVAPRTSSTISNIPYGASASSRVQSPTGSQGMMQVPQRTSLGGFSSPLTSPQSTEIPIGAGAQPMVAAAEIDTDVPTEELVRILNRRLQRSQDEWDPEEAPPNYTG